MRVLLTCLFTLFTATTASAFCGFYVAQEDGALTNEASRVVFAREGWQSTITMASDYKGPASDFAMIVPTPSVLEKRNIRTVRPETLAHLEKYTSPRLVEYPDYVYCDRDVVGGLAPEVMEAPVVVVDVPASAPKPRRGPRSLGVTIEAQYAVGNYDVLILSARQSDGLVTYLRQEGYRIPDGAEETLAAYIGMGMKFFVARVNLGRHAASERQDLSPLQISFQSRNFMLPLQLGKINSAGTQDLVIMTLTRNGRVEPANYPTAEVPTDMDIPIFIERVFPAFYKQMFARAARADTVMLEYAWDMGWCDPCADDPLSLHELRELGAVWVKDFKDNPSEDVFVTRMHLRYTTDSFRQDLMFRETDNTRNFQARYVMRQPPDTLPSCPTTQWQAAKRAEMAEEVETLRQLTGWTRASIQDRVRQSVPDYLR